MIRKVISLLKNKDSSVLLSNFFSLSLLNIINYAFPLFTIPYLTAVLGVENFGKYILSFTILQYLVVLISYGFDYSATKYVSNNQQNNLELSKVFTSVIIIRILLSVLFSAAIIIATNIGITCNLLYINGIGLLLGYSITPTWFFQGMERMKYVTLINFISKLITTILIFYLIKGEEDYILVNLLASIGALVSGILSFYLAISTFKIKLILVEISDLNVHFTQGWSLFLSTIFMSLYRETNVILLGFFADFRVIGYYSIAEKVVKAIQSIISPFTNVLFPFFGRRISQDGQAQNMKVYLKSFIKIFSILLISILVIIFIFSKYIILTLFGHNYLNSIIDLKLLSFIIFFGGLNYLLGIVGLINFGFEKDFTSSVLYSGVVSILFGCILIFLYGDIGASLTMVITEVVLFLLIIRVYLKNQLLSLN